MTQVLKWDYLDIVKEKKNVGEHEITILSEYAQSDRELLTFCDMVKQVTGYKYKVKLDTDRSWIPGISITWDNPNIYCAKRGYPKVFNVGLSYRVNSDFIGSITKDIPYIRVTDSTKHKRLLNDLKKWWESITEERIRLSELVEQRCKYNVDKDNLQQRLSEYIGKDGYVSANIRNLDGVSIRHIDVSANTLSFDINLYSIKEGQAKRLFEFLKSEFKS